jgi:hypothetical protein
MVLYALGGEEEGCGGGFRRALTIENRGMMSPGDLSKGLVQRVSRGSCFVSVWTSFSDEKKALGVALKNLEES